MEINILRYIAVWGKLEYLIISLATLKMIINNIFYKHLPKFYDFINLANLANLGIFDTKYEGYSTSKIVYEIF